MAWRVIIGKWRSTEVVVVVATFLGSVSWCDSRWGLRWNVACPVPEGDRAGCAYSLLVTVSYAGRACHPSTTCSGRDG